MCLKLIIYGNKIQHSETKRLTNKTVCQTRPLVFVLEGLSEAEKYFLCHGICKRNIGFFFFKNWEKMHRDGSHRSSFLSYCAANIGNRLVCSFFFSTSFWGFFLWGEKTQASAFSYRDPSQLSNQKSEALGTPTIWSDLICWAAMVWQGISTGGPSSLCVDLWKI